MSGFHFNPGAPELWTTNAVLSGRSRRHWVPPMEGTLSIKTVLAGKAVWETPNGRYEVSPETCVVLNHGQTYSLEIVSNEPVHTFCVFFKPDFFEEGFYERLRLTPDSLVPSLHRLRLLASEGANGGLEADEAMLETALALRLCETAPKEESRLDQVRASTREEIFRQLNRSRDFALAHLDKRISLDELALVACMSPFHYHRLHRQAFGETPHEFVTRARLRRATRLLKTADVGEVSLSLGFESVPTFTRLFKARMGVTPGAFRKIE